MHIHVFESFILSHFFYTFLYTNYELMCTFLNVALSAKIVNFCYPLRLSDMIDALIKRVSVTYKCYEMYAQVKKVQLLMF
jgi:hypothetical protein